MGFGGFGIAIAVLFLLVYFAPYLMRTRQMMVDAPIDERYVEELRVINCRTRIPSEARGRIFLTERTMATQMQPDKLRAAARDRSRARARMATRRVNQVRGFVIGGALAGLALLLWVLVAATTLPIGVAIASTIVGALYAVGFGYLVNVMTQADEEDRERIEKANVILGANNRPDAKFTPVSKAARTKVAAKPAAHKPADKPVAAESADVVKDLGSKAPVEKSTTTEAPAVETAAAQSDTKRALAPREVRVAAPAPSYTIKPAIAKRTVKPYVAPQQPVAESPFRPTKLGERIGDEKLEAANEAPQMTGNEELRSDVLGGGSTLDALLERRRA